MSLNEFMHPRNPYKNQPPDFKELARKFDEFRAYCSLGVNGKISVNFQEDGAVRSLTKALLKKDFELDVEIPKGNLVPRIPQKLNYILWIEDLLKRNNIDKDVLGIDIGTGASCVHALLGARQCRWRFVATDADRNAARAAAENVARNKLNDVVEVVHVQEDTMLKELVRRFSDTQFTFTMCNPPFFEVDETEKRFSLCEEENVYKNGSLACGEKRPRPNSATWAKRNELQVEGGEVAFVGRMIDDSILLREQIIVYTSMLGKKSSVAALKKRLSRIEGVRYTFAPLCQGRTQRWLAAWSYRKGISLDESCVQQKLTLPDKSSWSERVDIAPLAWIRDVFNALNIQMHTLAQQTVICEARSVTWTNTRAKRRAESLSRPPPEKRARCSSITTYDAYVQVCLGEGDGRDSYCDAGNFSTFESNADENDEKKRSVAVQVYHPVDVSKLFVIRFKLVFDEATRTFSFEVLEGSKHYLNQILQYLQNRLKQLFQSCQQRG